MSAIAGVFWRQAGGESTAAALYRALSAAVKSSVPQKYLTESVKPNCLLLKCDYSAYDSGGLESADPGSVAAICGHPHIEPLRGRPRTSHLEFLVTAAREGRLSGFSEARGSFTFAHSEPSAGGGGGRLILGGDCLGVRPLYYADTGNIVVFSSTLGLFRALSTEITGPADERATAETGVFGFPLGDRTHWMNVRCVPPGSVLVFESAGTRSVRYWTLSGVRPAENVSERESLREIFDRFGEAVSLRVGKRTTALATLSGGLDSRVVVAALRSLGVQVSSVNFAPAGSQDLVYGREIAAALGCAHTEIPMDSGGVFDRTKAALRVLQPQDEARGSAAPNVIWSGDGGSVLLGHVYLSEAMVQAAEEGNEQKAVDLLISDQSWYVPRRILRSAKAGAVADYPRIGLLEALRDEHNADPGRRLHIMLMSTDQRRHMHPHFERIYEHRCEMELPFFDRKVVEAVIGRRARPFLNHHFYNRWLALFPPAVATVPWQAYPGHEGCPLGERSALTYQWTEEFNETSRRLDRQKYLQSTWSALRAGRYEGTAISPLRLSLALLATAVGMRDLTYALKFSEAMAKP